MSVAIECRLAIRPTFGDDPTVRKIVREGGDGDPDVAFCLAEFAGLFAAAPHLRDACRAASAAIERAFPDRIPDGFADAYNRLHDALKAAEKGEMRI